MSSCRLVRRAVRCSWRRFTRSCSQWKLRFGRLVGTLTVVVASLSAVVIAWLSSGQPIVLCWRWVGTLHVLFAGLGAGLVVMGIWSLPQLSASSLTVRGNASEQNVRSRTLWSTTVFTKVGSPVPQYLRSVWSSAPCSCAPCAVVCL